MNPNLATVASGMRWLTIVLYIASAGLCETYKLKYGGLKFIVPSGIYLIGAPKNLFLVPEIHHCQSRSENCTPTGPFTDAGRRWGLSILEMGTSIWAYAYPSKLDFGYNLTAGIQGLGEDTRYSEGIGSESYIYSRLDLIYLYQGIYLTTQKHLVVDPGIELGYMLNLAPFGAAFKAEKGWDRYNERVVYRSYNFYNLGVLSFFISTIDNHICAKIKIWGSLFLVKPDNCLYGTIGLGMVLEAGRLER